MPPRCDRSIRWPANSVYLRDQIGSRQGAESDGRPPRRRAARRAGLRRGRRCRHAATGRSVGRRTPSTCGIRSDPAKVRSLMADLLAAEPLGELDYAEVVDAATLRPVDPLAGELRLLAGSDRIPPRCGV